MLSSYAPCAACGHLRKKCAKDCIFAPYFPLDYGNRQRFIQIHRAFGAARVSKLMKKIHPSQRQYALHTLLYEAKTRIADPTDNCLGRFNILQNMLEQWRHFVKIAKDELVTYIGSEAMIPMLQQTPGFPQQYAGSASSSAHAMQYKTMPKMGIPKAAAEAALAFHRERFEIRLREPQQERVFEAQQLRNAVVAAREIQEMFEGYEQQHQGQQQEIIRVNSGFQRAGSVHQQQDAVVAAREQQVQPSSGKGTTRATEQRHSKSSSSQKARKDGA